jgi:heat shock protein HtpX
MIDPATAVGEERELLQMVARIANRAGIEMPEVGIYESPEINAFCTGPTKNDSLVAVSTGLLRRMDKAELEGVLAHEISHAANGDMVTMTLVTGVVNTLVLLISMVLTTLLASQLRGDRREEGWGDYFLRQFIFSLVQGIVGLLAAVTVVLPFSRWREYRADAGGAALVGKSKMIGALEALRDNFRLPRPALAAAEAAGDPALATFKISSLKADSLFSSHPSLDDRIERLRKMVI